VADSSIGRDLQQDEGVKVICVRGSLNRVDKSREPSRELGALICPACVRADVAKLWALSFVRPCTSTQVGKSKRATGGSSPSGSSYLECGLTGLLNPTSIWHKSAFELLPIASVKDYL
jgi:hypothetical protein